MTVSTRVLDLTGDVLDGLLDRPVRALLLTIVFAVGSGGFVAAAGVSLSAAHQVTQKLTPSDLDEVTVREQKPGDLPEDAVTRVAAIDLVRAAATAWPLEPGTMDVASMPDRVARPATNVGAQVFGAGPDWLRLQETGVVPAGSADQLGSPAARHVALVGSGLAARTSMAAPGPGVKVWVGGQPFDVVGTVIDDGRLPGLTESVVISPAALRDLRPRATGVLTVRTAVGAAAPVAQRIAPTIRPDRPAILETDPVLDLEQLRRGVRTDLDRSISVVSGLVLVFAALTCGNVMIISVLGRTGEIGLRRALGTSRFGIATLFLAEGALTGLAGGVLGTALGLLTVLGVAASKDWTPVVNAVTVPLGPTIGTMVGLLAALYPALRAAAVEPAVAVRQTG